MINTRITEKHRQERVGLRKQNNDGSWMTIIEYNNARDLTVKFDTGYVAEHKYYSAFLNGSIRDVYFPIVKGVGFIGEGKYVASNNYTKSPAYQKWIDILYRCYRDNTNYPAYQECTICDEWLNYQNFAQFFEDNYYEVPNHTMSIDKDIIKKKNKIYCPEYCCFLPRDLNAIFEGLNVCKRGEYPVGVSFLRPAKRFEAYTHKKNRKIHIGYYDTPEEAFYAYKAYKESYIHEMTEKYKQWLPKRVYHALYSYEIDIND